MSALANPTVGDYLNRHYVSAYQKVATFKVIGGAKVGGNVASYFCDPDGRVLHALAGPVDAATFLREARWANETYQMAQLGKPSVYDLRAFFQKAQFERLTADHHRHINTERTRVPEALDRALYDKLLFDNRHLRLSDPGKVHLVLAVGAAPRLDQVYHVVFEGILNEKISTNPVDVAGR